MWSHKRGRMRLRSSIRYLAIRDPLAQSKTHTELDPGNFYSSRSDGDVSQTLQLEALPANLPLVECSTSCPCASRCANRVTQRGVRHVSCIPDDTLSDSSPHRVSMTIRSTRPETGLGLYFTPTSTHSSARVLGPGTFISLYAGEILSTAEARKRWSGTFPDLHHGQGNYTLSLRLPSETLHIDPRYVGNVGRFLNHSCEPNCVIHVVRWGGGPGWSRAAIFVSAAGDVGCRGTEETWSDEKDGQSWRGANVRLRRCVRRRQNVRYGWFREERRCRDEK